MQQGIFHDRMLIYRKCRNIMLAKLPNQEMQTLIENTDSLGITND